MTSARRYPATYEITLPGLTSDDLKAWASNITEANPITPGSFGRHDVRLEVTETYLMGIALSFIVDDEIQHTLALFGDTPTRDEAARVRELSMTEEDTDETC